MQKNNGCLWLLMWTVVVFLLLMLWGMTQYEQMDSAAAYLEGHRALGLISQQEYDQRIGEIRITQFGGCRVVFLLWAGGCGALLLRAKKRSGIDQNQQAPDHQPAPFTHQNGPKRP